MPLLCDRPHARSVDFRTSRFIVAHGGGIVIGDRKYERGDEVPRGALGADALRQEYEPPLRRIELADFVASGFDPDLREACARRGVEVGAPAAAEEAARTSRPEPAPSTVSFPDLDRMSRRDMAEYCDRNGIERRKDDSRRDLRKRIVAGLG